MKTRSILPAQIGPIELPFVEEFSSKEKANEFLCYIRKAYGLEGSLRVKFVGRDLDADRGVENETRRWMLYYFQGEEPSLEETQKMIEAKMGNEASSRMKYFGWERV